MILRILLYVIILFNFLHIFYTHVSSVNNFFASPVKNNLFGVALVRS